MKESDWVLVAGGLGATLVFCAVNPVVSPLRAMTREPTTILGRRMTQQETLQRLAANHREYHWMQNPQSVAGARKIPIVSPTWTPLFEGHTHANASLYHGGSGEYEPFKQGLRAWRQYMRDAGRADEDARCTFWLFLKETAWGRACWGKNTGNRKAPGVMGNEQTILAPGDPHVYDTNPYSVAVYCLVDLVRSFDVYRAFGSWSDSIRDEKRLFETPLYARHNVLQGYRQGGLEGLQSAITAMSDAGYSPGPALQKRLECAQYWRMATRMAGSEFVR